MRGYLQKVFAAANDGAAPGRNAGSAFEFRSRSTIPSNSDGMDHLLRALDHEHQRLGQELRDSAGQLIACLQRSIARLDMENPEHACLIREIQDIMSEIADELGSLALSARDPEVRPG
jgi:hypothetical protein